jgi:diazepam-binding inhibitor (GABA receptor modulating acyl-CoA-binding protein)
MTDLESEFNLKSEKIRNSTVNPSITIENNVKLNFYKYYKQSTIGDCNTEQPYIYQFEKRALWDAWNSIKGTSKEDAMKMYIYYADLYLD